MSGDVGSTPGEIIPGTPEAGVTGPTQIDAVIRVQNRANRDREFWNLNYRPVAQAIAGEVRYMPVVQPNYNQQLSRVTQESINQFDRVREAQIGQLNCAPEPYLNPYGLAGGPLGELNQAQSLAWGMGSVLRMEEQRAFARNADRHAKQMTMIAQGRQLDSDAASMAQQAAKENEIAAMRAAQVSSTTGEVLGTILNRALASPAAPYTPTQLQPRVNFVLPQEPMGPPQVNVQVASGVPQYAPQRVMWTDSPDDEKPPK